MADRHGRVRLQQEVRHRLADDVAAADHHGPRTVELDVMLLEQRHHAARRRGDERRPSEVELAGVERMEPVDVLRRRDRADHLLLVDVVGQRQLDEDRVDVVRAFSSASLCEQLGLARRRGQPQICRVEPGLDRSLVLEPDVELRGRVVADEHRHEADVADRAHLLGHLCADAVGERLPPHQSRSSWPTSLGSRHALAPEERRRLDRGAPRARWASTAAS